MKLRSFAFAVVVVCPMSQASAHHGNSEYDLTITVRYEGVVTELLWRNPHSIVKLETRTAAGEPMTLEIEGGAPAMLRTAGFTANSIAKGDRVTAVVSPSRRFPERFAFGRDIIKADGSVVALTSFSLPKPQVNELATDVYGTWVPTVDLFQNMRAWVRGFRLTEKGQGIRDRYSPTMSAQAACAPLTAPILMTYPVALALKRSSDGIAIASDWIGAERTVYLDGRPHPPSQQRFVQGHSVGRWENEVLVVDTTNFADEVTWAGLSSGGAKHVVERFAVSNDGTAMNYSFVWEDAEYLAEPVSGDGQLRFRPDLELEGTECDLESARRFFQQFE
jgi:Family of unknown function (DUF6152)